MEPSRQPMTSANTSSNSTDDRLVAQAAALVGDDETRPTWVWNGNGSTLIWANAAGLDVLGAENLDDLPALDVTPTRPASRSLVAVARTPVGAGGRGRIEILRVATARHQETLVAICKPVLLGEDVAVLAVASGPTRSAQKVPVAQLRQVDATSEPDTEPALSAVPDQPPVSESEDEAPSAELSAGSTHEPTEAEFHLDIDGDVADQAPTASIGSSASQFAFKPRSRPHRFSFLVDPSGKIRSLSSGLADAVGEKSSLRDGDDAVEALERIAHGIEPIVRNAIAERRRFAEHSVSWPVSDHALDVPVRLSGFDEDDGELRVFGTVLTGNAEARAATSLPAIQTDIAGLETAASDDPADGVPRFSGTSDADTEALTDVPVVHTTHAPSGAALAAAASALTAGVAAAMAGSVEPSAGQEDSTASDESVTALDDHLEEGEAQVAGLWTNEPAEPDAQTSSAVPIIALDDELTSSEAATAGLWSETPNAAETASGTDIPADRSAATTDQANIPESTRKAMAAVAAGLAAGLASGPIRPSTSPDQEESSEEPPVFKPVETPVQEDDGLSRPERLTCQEIARRLGARITGHEEDEDIGITDERPSDGSPPPSDVVTFTPGQEDHSANEATAETDIGDDNDEPSSSGAQVLAFSRTEPNAERMVLDRLPLGVIIYHERTILYANRAALEISGRSTLAALKEHDGVDSLFAHGSEGLESEDGAMILVRPDGTRVSVAGRLQSVRWDGQSAAMLSIREQSQQESEEREQAHDAALTSAAAVATADALPLVRARIGELEAIVDLASDGVVTLDAQGEIKDLNQAAQALVGYSADDLMGRPFRLLFAEDSRQVALDYLDDIAEQGRLSLFNEGREVECMTAQGGLVPVFMTLGRLTDDQPPAFCAVLRDLSPFKQAETDLVAARRAAEEASAHKSDFLARVSHEIRTPLNAVIGFSEVMLEERFGPVGSERYRQYLRDIHTSGEHLMSLLNDLLDLSKIEAGKMELSFGEVDLNDVVQQCLAIMQPQANQGRIIVRTSLPLSVPKVVADIRSVRQIALNLMSNAIKFTDPGGQIIVSTLYEPSGEVSLRVRDTGRGMDAADVELALEPFRQVPTTLNQVITGTGLGLPLTKALVEANRAQFMLDSTPGEGTLAKVTFPLQRVLAE
jgi:PAS domain S-box-containing protein